MNGFGALFKSAMRTFLEDRGISAKEIVGFNEETKLIGFCDTCSYEETVIEIEYTTTDGGWGVYNHSGSFIELINELTRDV